MGILSWILESQRPDYGRIVVWVRIVDLRFVEPSLRRHRCRPADAARRLIGTQKENCTRVETTLSSWAVTVAGAVRVAASNKFGRAPPP